MNCRSKKNMLFATARGKGFSLVEVVAALSILAIISSSVLVVVNRSMESAANSALRVRAFEVARENMEALLYSDSVEEITEYGISDRYPQIEWQSTVETFYEPLTSRMWAQAVCSAQYEDTQGQQQTVELTHWLANLTKKQLLEIITQQKDDKDILGDQVIDSKEDAAEYAGVDVDTIDEWVEKGMLQTGDEHFIKNQLDLFASSDGNPSAEDIELQSQADAKIIDAANRQSEPKTDEPSDNSEDVKRTSDGVIWGENTVTFGDEVYTYTELESMSVDQLWEIGSSKR